MKTTGQGLTSGRGARERRLGDGQFVQRLLQKRPGMYRRQSILCAHRRTLDAPEPPKRSWDCEYCAFAAKSANA